jgi:ABC-type oligopeptide transport system substrate-binding subunit
MPGAGTVDSHAPVLLQSAPGPLRLSLAWATADLGGSKIAAELRRNGKQLSGFGITLSFRPVATVRELLALHSDLVLLGWSPKVFDPYNLLDLFPCGSAFNVARWCDPSYDALMGRAVRNLDDRARWQIERRLVEKLHDAVPAIPVYTPTDHYRLAPGVRGFSWSPIGFYELMGMTRS